MWCEEKSHPGIGFLYQQILILLAVIAKHCLDEHKKRILQYIDQRLFYIYIALSCWLISHWTNQIVEIVFSFSASLIKGLLMSLMTSTHWLDLHVDILNSRLMQGTGDGEGGTLSVSCHLVDVLLSPVRPSMTETTALGAAVAAGTADGINVWNFDDFHSSIVTMDTFLPSVSKSGVVIVPSTICNIYIYIYAIYVMFTRHMHVISLA